MQSDDLAPVLPGSPAAEIAPSLLAEQEARRATQADGGFGDQLGDLADAAAEVVEGVFILGDVVSNIGELAGSVAETAGPALADAAALAAGLASGAAEVAAPLAGAVGELLGGLFDALGQG